MGKYTHGKSNTRLYGIWTGMKTRCYDKRCAKYYRYGARGISLCDDWARDFSTFYDWAVANGYSDNLTIDRIDNDGNYCPENCRWITAAEQAANKSTNHRVSHAGQTHTIAEWARITGLDRALLKDRIVRYGWEPGRALTTPARPHKKYEYANRRAI